MIKITQLRKHKGWTQRELAEKVGVSMIQLHLVEHEKYQPTPVTLIKLGRVLGVDPAELMQPWDELDD